MLSFFTDFSERYYWMLIAASTILFLVAVETGLRSTIVDVRNTTPNLVHQVYTSDSHDIALGDSHIYRAFIHSDDILNLGRGGLSTRAIRRIGEAYFKHRTSGHAIIGVGPQMLSRPVSPSRFDRFFGQYNLLGRGLYAFEPGINSHATWFLKQDRRDKTIRHHEQNLRIGGHWLAVPQEQRQTRISAGIRSQRPDWDGSAQAGVDEIRNLLSTFSRLGVQSCLLLTPLAQDYRRAIETDADYQRAFSEFAKLAREAGIPLVDSNALIPALTDADFINQDHLAATRSATFSDAVEVECFKAKSL